jgi:hypothetical protein
VPVQQLESPRHDDRHSPHRSGLFVGWQYLESAQTPPPPSRAAQQPLAHSESEVHSYRHVDVVPSSTQSWFVQQSPLTTHDPPASAHWLEEGSSPEPLKSQG